MTVLALCSLKGGVGKSTAAANLGVLAAQAGESTLVWDLDAQGAAGHTLARGSVPLDASRGLFRGDRSLRECIVPTRIGGLDLVAAASGLRRDDRTPLAKGYTERFVRRALRDVAGTYRWAFLDCPPGLSRFVEGLITAADVLLVPVVPSPLSLRAFERMVLFLERKGRPPRLIPFFSMVEGRRTLHQRLMNDFLAAEPATCSAVIPRRSEVEAAANRGMPVVLARPASAAAKAFRELWAEVRSLPASWGMGTASG